MATETAFKKLEAQLNCPICLDTYTNAKQLQCNHIFCRHCLSRVIIRDEQGQLTLTCPTCRQVTPVPASGVGSLQTAFQINQLVEIVEEHKRAIEATASKERGENASISAITPTRNTTVGCPEHNGKDVVLYCSTCEKTICYKCIKNGAKHHSHKYEELYEALGKYKKEITPFLEPMEKQLGIIKKALAQLDTRCEEISNQQGTIEANIHDTIARLHQTLDVRKTELISQLHRLTQDKLKSLAVQRDQIETTQAQLSSCLHFMRENLKTGNQGEALMMKRTTVRQVKELTTTFQPDLLEPNTEADMTFSASADHINTIRNLGQILTKSSPDPSKCTATGKGVEEAAVGKKSIILLQTLSFNNLPSKEALDSITCELVSEITGTRVGGSVERRGQSQYEISYQPTIKGRHRLHIKVEGQHIRGSPFPVTARSSVEKLGTPILTIDEVDGPEGVAINKKGEMVVAERYGCCVTVFSPRGEKIRSFGTRGSGQGQFNDPYGVAVDREGCILVTDRYNNRIQKFSPEGDFLTVVGSRGSGPLQFHNPQGIIYNTSNDKVYVSDTNCQIQVLNSDLSYVTSFGKKGKGEGEFGNPRHLACDSLGNVYVADNCSHFVQVFTAEGKFLRMFEKNGGQLRGPIGLAVDASNRVYVSEWNNHCVSVFNSEGQFLLSFGSKGTEPGQFDYPSGLAVDFSGVVYACNFGSRYRVQMF